MDLIKRVKPIYTVFNLISKYCLWMINYTYVASETGCKYSSWGIDHKIVIWITYFYYVIRPYVLTKKDIWKDVFSYEIYWVIGVLILIVTQHILNWYFNLRKNNMRYMRNYCIDNLTEYQKWFFVFVNFIIAIAITIFFVWIICTNDTNSVIMLYGRKGAVWLWILTMLLFVPSFVNIFYLIYSFYKHFKSEFLAITNMKELAEKGELIYVLKTINYYVLSAYSVYFILVIMSFGLNKENNISLLEWMFAELRKGEISAGLILMAAYVVLPLLFGFFYYIFIIKNFKSIITITIARFYIKDLDNIFTLYFNAKSEYALDNVLIYCLSPVVIPVLTLILQALINK